jgi:hypothetical protein
MTMRALPLSWQATAMDSAVLWLQGFASADERFLSARISPPLDSLRTSVVLPRKQLSDPGGCKQNDQAEQSSPQRIVNKRLADTETLAVNRHTNQPVIDPSEVRYGGMLELRVAVRAEHEQVSRVMSDVGVKVVHLKIRLTVRFLEGEGAELTPPIMQLAKENANSRRYSLVTFCGARTYLWTWPAD